MRLDLMLIIFFQKKNVNNHPKLVWVEAHRNFIGFNSFQSFFLKDHRRKNLV